MFGGVLLFQNFSASYTSFLAVTTEYKPFDSLQDLLENTDYSIGTPKGYATKEMFQVLIAVKEDTIMSVIFMKVCTFLVDKPILWGTCKNEVGWSRKLRGWNQKNKDREVCLPHGCGWYGLIPWGKQRTMWNSQDGPQPPQWSPHHCLAQRLSICRSIQLLVSLKIPRVVQLN